jgi:hypothetical protein
VRVKKQLSKIQVYVQRNHTFMVTSLLKREVFIPSSFFISHRGQFKFKFGGVDIQLCLMLVSAMFIQFFL